jgi:hypothetical protein
MKKISLEKDHWLYKEGTDAPPTPMYVAMGAPKRKKIEKDVKEAARWAIRVASKNGADHGFDPDLLVEYFVIGLLGK